MHVCVYVYMYVSVRARDRHCCPRQCCASSGLCACTWLPASAGPAPKRWGVPVHVNRLDSSGAHLLTHSLARKTDSPLHSCTCTRTVLSKLTSFMLEMTCKKFPSGMHCTHTHATLQSGWGGWRVRVRSHVFGVGVGLQFLLPQQSLLGVFLRCDWMRREAL